VAEYGAERSGVEAEGRGSVVLEFFLELFFLVYSFLYIVSKENGHALERKRTHRSKENGHARKKTDTRSKENGHTLGSKIRPRPVSEPN